VRRYHGANTTEAHASPAASAAAPRPRLAAASPKPTPTALRRHLFPPAPAQTTVTFLSAPLTVARGSNATLQVRNRTQHVLFDRGRLLVRPSTASGLAAKTSDATGNVAWTWRVGANHDSGKLADHRHLRWRVCKDNHLRHVSRRRIGLVVAAALLVLLLWSRHRLGCLRYASGRGTNYCRSGDPGKCHSVDGLPDPICTPGSPIRE